MDAQTRKARWVAKNFGHRKTPRDVLQALDRLGRGQDAKLASEDQPQLGITILRAYLAPENTKKLRDVCKKIPAEKGEHAKAINRIILILGYWKRRYVWGYY